MTHRTDQWLHDQFQAQAQTIEVPAALHGETLQRARAARTRHRGIRAALAVGAAALVTGVLVIVTGSLSPATTPAAPAPTPASWTFDLFFVDMGGINSTRPPSLVSEQVTVPNTGDQPLDIVNALMGSVAEGDGVNGFNFSSTGGSPIAEVNSVTVIPNKLITVDLDRDVMDPHPTWDCNCPPGDVVMQQLVWTLGAALGNPLPVLLTINGDPARGIWGHRLDGPVYLEQVQSSIDRELPGDVTDRAKALLGNRFVDLSVGEDQASYIIGVLNLQDSEIDDLTAKLQDQVRLHFEPRTVPASATVELRHIVERAFTTDRQGVRVIGSNLATGRVLVGVADTKIPTTAQTVSDLLPGPQAVTRTNDGSALICDSDSTPTRPCVIVKAVGLGELN